MALIWEDTWAFWRVANTTGNCYCSIYHIICTQILLCFVSCGGFVSSLWVHVSSISLSLRSCFAGNGAIIWFFYCQWSQKHAGDLQYMLISPNVSKRLTISHKWFQVCLLLPGYCPHIVKCDLVQKIDGIFISNWLTVVYYQGLLNTVKLCKKNPIMYCMEFILFKIGNQIYFMLEVYQSPNICSVFDVKLLPKITVLSIAMQASGCHLM